MNIHILCYNMRYIFCIYTFIHYTFQLVDCIVTIGLNILCLTNSHVYTFTVRDYYLTNFMLIQVILELYLYVKYY